MTSKTTPSSRLFRSSPRLHCHRTVCKRLSGTDVSLLVNVGTYYRGFEQTIELGLSCDKKQSGITSNELFRGLCGRLPRGSGRCNLRRCKRERRYCAAVQLGIVPSLWRFATESKAEAESKLGNVLAHSSRRLTF
jgi:hypothetical protein